MHACVHEYVSLFRASIRILPYLVVWTMWDKWRLELCWDGLWPKPWLNQPAFQTWQAWVGQLLLWCLVGSQLVPCIFQL